MPIANYTTEVAASKSIAEIEAMLIIHNAKSVFKEFNPDHTPASISFVIATQDGEFPFRLPANVDKVKVVLNKMRVNPIPSWDEQGQRRLADRASRVGWRILRDWVRAQMAIIEAEMVTLDEVFLPYMLVGKNNKTLHQAMVERKFLLKSGTEGENDEHTNR